MVSRNLILLAFLALFAGVTLAVQEDGAMGLEQSVCGLKEPLMFWLWSHMAGSPNADAARALLGVLTNNATRDRWVEAGLEPAFPYR